MFKKIIKPLDIISINVSTNDPKVIPDDGAICQILVELAIDHEEFKDWTTFPLNKTIEITLGNGASPGDFLIEGCLQTMAVGDIVVVRIRKCDIYSGSSQTLVTDPLSVVELKLTLENVSPVLPLWKMTPQQLANRAIELKAQGIHFYEQGKIQWAFWKFSKATKLLIIADSCEKTEVENSETRRLKLSLYLNIAACQLKCEQYEYVVENCDLALQIDDSNVKGYFRRGMAYSYLQEYKKAVDDLNKVLFLEPTNKAAAQMLQNLKHKIEASNKNLSKALQNMFK